MISKLRELSKIIVVPTIILYFLGFICVNSCLGRFGIVDFDIFNPRFIIAGIFPLLFLGTAFYIFQDFFKRLNPNKFFSTEKFGKKILIHIYFIGSLFAASYGFYLLFKIIGSLGNKIIYYSTMVFKPLLGDFDLIGEYINYLPFISSIGYDFIIKWTIYFFSYIFILISFFFILRMIVKNCLRLFMANKDEKNKSNNQKEDINKDNKINGENIKKDKKLFIVFLQHCFNWLMFIFYLALFFYSILKLYIEIFNFNSFENFSIVSMGIIFAWLFFFNFIFYAYLNYKNYDEKDFNLEKIKEKIKDVDLNILQGLFVPLLVIFCLFGMTVFPRIPFILGGGEPRPVKIEMIDNATFNGNLYLIGENEQFLFLASVDNVANIGKAFEINKDLIVSIETKNMNMVSEEETENLQKMNDVDHEN